MEYHGKLYGKIGNKYFDTGKSSADFEKLKSDQTQIEKLEAEKKELLDILYNARLALSKYDDQLSYDILSIIQKIKK